MAVDCIIGFKGFEPEKHIECACFAGMASRLDYSTPKLLGHVPEDTPITFTYLIRNEGYRRNIPTKADSALMDKIYDATFGKWATQYAPHSQTREYDKRGYRKAIHYDLDRLPYKLVTTAAAFYRLGDEHSWFLPAYKAIDAAFPHLHAWVKFWLALQSCKGVDNVNKNLRTELYRIGQNTGHMPIESTTLTHTRQLKKFVDGTIVKTFEVFPTGTHDYWHNDEYFRLRTTGRDEALLGKADMRNDWISREVLRYKRKHGARSFPSYINHDYGYYDRRIFVDLVEFIDKILKPANLA